MRTLLVAAVALSLVACSGKKKPAAEAPPEEAACTTGADCADGMVCLGGACTNPAAGAVYTDPSNAVTPDKMKRELEQRGAGHAADVDRALEAE